jgi:hypothetical protein
MEVRLDVVQAAVLIENGLMTGRTIAIVSRFDVDRWCKCTRYEPAYRGGGFHDK